MSEQDNKWNRISYKHIYKASEREISIESNTESLQKMCATVLSFIKAKDDFDEEGDDGDSDEEPDFESLSNKNLDHRKLKYKNKKVKPDLMYS